MSGNKEFYYSITVQGLDLILDGIEREVVNWTKEFITFWKSQTMKEISEPRNFKPDTLDRISGSYGSYNCRVVKKTLF